MDWLGTKTPDADSPLNWIALINELRTRLLARYTQAGLSPSGPPMQPTSGTSFHKSVPLCLLAYRNTLAGLVGAGNWKNSDGTDYSGPMPDYELALACNDTAANWRACVYNLRDVIENLKYYGYDFTPESVKYRINTNRGYWYAESVQLIDMNQSADPADWTPDLEACSGDAEGGIASKALGYGAFGTSYDPNGGQATSGLIYTRVSDTEIVATTTYGDVTTDYTVGDYVQVVWINAAFLTPWTWGYIGYHVGVVSEIIDSTHMRITGGAGDNYPDEGPDSGDDWDEVRLRIRKINWGWRMAGLSRYLHYDLSSISGGNFHLATFDYNETATIASVFGYHQAKGDDLTNITSNFTSTATLPSGHGTVTFTCKRTDADQWASPTFEYTDGTSLLSASLSQLSSGVLPLTVSEDSSISEITVPSDLYVYERILFNPSKVAPEDYVTSVMSGAVLWNAIGGEMTAGGILPADTSLQIVVEFEDPA